MIQPGMSAEEMVRQADAVIKSYRAGCLDQTEERCRELRADAITLIRELGFSEGDAQRWLDAKAARR